jgi:integrase/recombinase XerD
MVKPLQAFDLALSAYLKSRRALGRAYRGEERVLGKLRSHLLASHRSDLDERSFAAWRRTLTHCTHNTQVDYAVGILKFCRYRRRGEPGCFLPERSSIGRHRPYPLPSPVGELEVARLLEYMDCYQQARDRKLRRAALRVALILLHTTGLRRGELARLTLGDMDIDAGVLRIQASKFHKSRWVPLSASAGQALKAYLQTRLKLVRASAASSQLLYSCATRPYNGNGLSSAIKRIMQRSEIWPQGKLPRVHDLRHGFAVSALKRWYHEGRDVQAELPKLAMYMGHVSIASTAHYLRYMPAVVELASGRFDKVFGGIVSEDAS